jgi:hypothetical protein
MSAPISLVSERNDRAARVAKALREELLERCRAAIDGLDDVSGFALVVWGKNGDMRTAYNAAEGPIGPALVPTLVSDALNRHVAVMLAKDEISGDAGSM